MCQAFHDTVRQEYEAYSHVMQALHGAFNQAADTIRNEVPMGQQVVAEDLYDLLRYLAALVLPSGAVEAPEATEEEDDQ